MAGAWIPKELYGKLVDAMPIPTVDVVVFAVRKKTTGPPCLATLMGKRKNEPGKGTWYTFGGRLFKGETFRECAVRQLREEACVTTEEELHFGGVIDEMFEVSAFDCPTHCANVFYWTVLKENEAEAWTGKGSDENQHADLRWWDADEATRHAEVHPLAREKIAKVLAAARDPTSNRQPQTCGGA